MTTLDRTTLAKMQSTGNYSISINVGTYSDDHQLDPLKVAEQLRSAASLIEQEPELMAAFATKEPTR